MEKTTANRKEQRSHQKTEITATGTLARIKEKGSPFFRFDLKRITFREQALRKYIATSLTQHR